MSRLFDDLVVSTNSGAGSSRARAWPLSLAVHAMAISVLASLSVKVVKEHPAPPGPVIFHSSPRPQPSAVPTVRAGTPAHRRAPRTVPTSVDALPVVRADGLVADAEPDVLESPVGDVPLCLGCVPGAPGGGDGTSPGGSGVPGDGSGVAPRRAGGEIREPRRIHGAPPPYPDLARRARVEGKVVLECVIDERGRVRDLRVVSGHPLLADAAAEAVGAWIYTPTTLNGQAVAVILNVTVKFELGRH
jgi:protein TonB